MIGASTPCNANAAAAAAMTAAQEPGVLWKRLLPELPTLELLLALGIFLTIHALRQKRQRGLPVWPALGMLPSLLLGLSGDAYEWVTEVLVRQGGTFVFKGPCLTALNCVVTADPRNVEHLLKTRFAAFPKGPHFRDALHDLLGDGIFNADDDAWRHQRKTASLEFHSAAFRRLTSSSLLDLVHSRLLPVLHEAAQRRAAVDLQSLLLRLTFDNVCMLAFGVDPGCLAPGLPEIPFARSFEDATEASSLRFLMPTTLWKAMRLLDVGPERKLRRAIRTVDQFADQVIRTRKKELEHELGSKSNSGQRSDLLTAFMRSTDEDGKPYSDRFLRDICVNFILAGRDTSSVALAWFFWLLDRNPEAERRILSEIRGILGEREYSHSGKESGRCVFSPEEVKKMEYLQAALSEALRLYPSVPVDHKEVVEDDEFPDGRVLKKRTKIFYVIYAMGRMESVWGKDCQEFKPERWLRGGRFVAESVYKFTAFNGGPRLCLGKDFAYYQMKFVAASILARYRVKVVANHPVEPKIALTMYMKHGLKVTLSRRDDPLTGAGWGPVGGSLPCGGCGCEF